MTPVTLYADFNNADPEGRVRLNAAGTLRDLARQGVQLREGLAVVVHDEELAADGEAEFSAGEGVWAARIDWSLVRPWLTEPVTAAHA